MRLGTDHTHCVWDNTIEPAAEITSGDRLELDLVESSGGQLSRSSTGADVTALDLSRVNPVTGPVKVRGARPGDALVVHVREITTEAWGWSAIIPGFGLLASDFPDPALYRSVVRDTVVALPFGPRLPLRPMIGTLGVALPTPGAHSLLPPSRFGGNLDIRHVTAGASITLPVGVPGALLSVGDAHAAMGDGEVCGTGVEVSARVVLDVEVRPGAAPMAPVLVTDTSSHRTGPALATTGVANDLMTASRDAARAMVEQVARRTGLSAAESYVLASVTADLKISEVVDAPNWVVSMHMPLAALD